MSDNWDIYFGKYALRGLPGIMDTVLSALNTLNVLRPARFPTSIPIVAYPLLITTKSSQFQGFRRYVYLFNINPFAIDFITISAVYTARKKYLQHNEKQKAREFTPHRSGVHTRAIICYPKSVTYLPKSHTQRYATQRARAPSVLLSR